VDRDDWDRRHAAGDHHFGGAPSSFFVAEAERLAPGRALDLACGSGRNAVWLAERGWQVTGVDFSAVALESARRLAAGRGVEVEWVHADVREWRPAQAAYDLVGLVYVHLTAEERRAVLQTAAGALAPHGTLVVVGHDLTNLTDGVGGPRDPSVLFTPDDVAAELPELAVERAERVRRETDAGVAIDALVRARK
jgi:SAM-dependent methyltransferase